MSGELVEDSVTEKKLGNCREKFGSSTGNAEAARGEVLKSGH